jgi:hypothetical protein
MTVAGSIGDFDFCVMRGGIALPQLARNVTTRAGVSGETVFFNGLHGNDFWLECCVDVASLLAANDVSFYHQFATALQPQLVVKAGILQPVLFHILEVRPIAIHKVVGGVGGIMGSGAGALVWDAWRLMPVTPVVNPFS